MNVPYLLKVLETDKLEELVAVIELPPIDMNLAIWGAIERGEIEIDEKKGKITVLKDFVPWSDPALAVKLLAVIKHYTANETNITVGRMNSYIKDPTTGKGYPLHEYLMTMQFLIDTGQVVEEVVSIPKTPKRPFHRFVFLCLPGNDNAEWNAKSVNKWITEFESSKTK